MHVYAFETGVSVHPSITGSVKLGETRCRGLVSVVFAELLQCVCFFSLSLPSPTVSFNILWPEQQSVMEIRSKQRHVYVSRATLHKGWLIVCYSVCKSYFAVHYGLYTNIKEDVTPYGCASHLITKPTQTTVNLLWVPRDENQRTQENNRMRRSERNYKHPREEVVRQTENKMFTGQEYMK